MSFSTRTRRRAAAAFTVALAVSAPSPAADGAGALVDRLQASYDRLDSLQAEFVQVLHSVAFPEPQEERGTVYLRRPALMRWEYRSPEAKLAVVDGARTYLYIPAENQVIVGNLEEVRSSGAAGLLLAGEVDLRRDFEIRPGPTAEETAAGTASLTLIPREASAAFVRIDLTLSLQTLLPVRILVHAPLGDMMEYRLEGVRTGMPLDASLFRFDLPEGVEVILAE